MIEKNYDIAIIGGGPGGYTAAIRAAQLGFSVCLVEKKHLGGTCLNEGCISTKALEQCANVYENALNAKTFGISIPEANFDWPSIQKFKNRVVLRLRKGVESLMTKNKIAIINGHGRLAGVDSIDIEGTTIQANDIIIATGSYAKSLPSLPSDGEKIISSEHALVLETLPRRFLIVGAGPIGCEFGYLMSTLGVQVTLVEALERALPMEDEDISTEYESVLKRRKVKLHVSSSVERVESTETGVKAWVKPRDGGDEFAIEADQVLVSVGRGAAIDDIGLEKIGYPVDGGFIKVDGMMRTGAGNVRAIGDVVGGLMLAHKAAAEGILAVESICGLKREPLAYENIPRVTYTRPEVASVGLKENEARERYSGKVKVSKFPFAAIGKALVIGEGAGFVKLIAAGDEGRLVGAHAIGPHATDLIATAATPISLGVTAERFAHIVQAHPTLSEIWMEAAHGLVDGPINL